MRHLLAHPRLTLAGIVLLALGLRLYGLDWGGFHPDEWAIGAAVYHLAWPDSPGQILSTESPLNPGWFNYGSAPLYLFWAASGLVGLARGIVPGLPTDVVLWRSLMGAADVVTLLLLVFLGRRLYGEAVGLLAGLLYALAVLPIQLSHFYAVDPLLSTALLASLAASVAFVQRGSLRWGVAASAAAGLALAAKASGAVFLLPAVLAWVIVARRQALLGEDGRRWATRALALGGAVAFLAFVAGQPYALLDWRTFWNDVLFQARLVRGTVELPYTIQYDQTTPYLYHLRNLVVWGLGPVLGLVAVAGALLLGARAVVHRRPAELLLAAALLVPFLLLGPQQVKFMRYLLPLYPLLALVAALLLVQAARFLSHGPRRLRWAAPALVLAVVLPTGLYALAFVNIYSQTHTALRMGRWALEVLPPNPVIAFEAWDQGLPEVGGIRPVHLDPYGPDDEAKVQRLASALTQADYAFLFSNRAYGALPRLPERFPLMRHYYQELLSGSLGYRVLRVEATYPHLLGVSLVDDTFRVAGLDLPSSLTRPVDTPLALMLGPADESFTVYDHPKTILLVNDRHLSAAELEGRLRPALTSAAATAETPLLMMEPALVEAQRAGGTWREIFADAGLPVRAPVFLWLLAVQGIALAGLPLALRLFRPLPDRGYLLAKVLSLLLVSYLTWLGASLRLLPFSRASVLLAIGLLAAASALVGYATRRELLHVLRTRWRLFLIGEALFLLAFALFALVRAANPDLWHPFRGGEKPMDLAYLIAVTRSTYMPPYDPWFAEGYLNYYYFGQFLVATLIRLTGIVPEVAFNLAVPLFWALTVGGAFSIVYNITEASRDWRGTLRLTKGPILAGLAGAALVALAGNLDGAVQVIGAVREGIASATGPWETATAALGALPEALDWGQHNYWRSSRMIAVPGSISITEFPFFTFLFADLHAHLLALPLALLAIGLAVALALATATRRRLLSYGLPLLALALTLGALFATNAWDYPTYLIVGPGAVAVAHLSRGTPPLRAAAWAAATLLALLALSVLAFLPFHQHNVSFYTELVRSPEQTPLRSYLAIFGLPLAILVSALALALGRQAAPWTAKAPAATRGQITIAAGAEARRTWASLAILLGLAAVAVSLADIGYTVVAVNAVLLLGLLVVILSPRTPLPQRLGFSLGALALLLIAGIDLYAVNDHLVRMNTIFRVYLQAWVLLGLAAAVLLWWLAREGAFRGLRRSPPRAALAATLALLALAASVYPLLGTRARLADRIDTTLPLTLDGLAFAETGTYLEIGERPVELRWEVEALTWLRENVEGSPVVAEAVIPPPPHDNAYYRVLSRVAMYTGLPTIVGWPWHQTQQRGIGRAEPLIERRLGDVRALYGSGDSGRIRQILRTYDVSYIYVGQLERIFYPAAGLEALAQLPELEVVYDENPHVTIYRVRRDAQVAVKSSAP